MNEFATQWADQIWRACWQGALTALAALILLAVWKRAPSRIRCWIWWLVCLKMLIGLIPLDIGVPVLPPAMEPAPVSSQQYSIAPETFVAAESAEELLAEPERTEPTVYVLAIWGLLAVGVAVLAARPALRVWRTVREGEPLNRDLAHIAVSASIPLRMRRTPRVLVSKAPIGPLALGLFKPVVLVPETTIRTCSPEELRWILAHEFAHLQRKDALLGVIPQLAQVLFVFNPVVWLACREYGLAREAACDEIALGAYSMPCDVYAKLLLRLGVKARPALCTPGVSPHFRNLHRRITMLESSNRSSSPLSRRLAPLSVLAAALVLAPFSLVHAQSAAPPPPPPPAAPSRPGSPSPVSPAAPGQPAAPAQPAPPAQAAARPTPAPPRVTTSVKVAPGDRVTMVPIRYADASSLAIKLRKQFKSGVKLLVDAQQNTIIIAASATKTKQVEKAIAKLDKGSRPVTSAPAIAMPAPPPMPPGESIPSAAVPGLPAPPRDPASRPSAPGIPSQIPPPALPQAAAGPDGRTPPPPPGSPAISSPSGIVPTPGVPGAPSYAPTGQPQALPGSATPAIAPSAVSPAGVIATPLPGGTAMLAPSSSATVIYHLKYVTASKAAKALNKKYGAKTPWVWIDEATNSLLIQGNLQRRADVHKFLAGFDKKK